MSVLLETRGLLKQFGEFRAVDAVDFRVQEGEVLALIVIVFPRGLMGLAKDAWQKAVRR